MQEKVQGLYDPRNEHDACGIGAIVNIDGKKSHYVIKECLNILKNLEHRGGVGAEDNTGDGAGILMQIPHEFFKAAVDFEIGDEGDYAVAQIFLSKNQDVVMQGKELISNCLKQEGIELLGWRKVPVNPDGIGKTAIMAMPFIIQAFIKRPKNIERGMDFERKLYTTRRIIEKIALEKKIAKFYFCSFSSKTIVYKGMLLATQVEGFYLDLMDYKMKSAIALVHSRFSTNTFPSWEKAHPNRYVVHNGEINTIRGNVDSIKAREGLFKSRVLDLDKVYPVIAKESSDSAMFDNTLEFFHMAGRSLEECLMMMIPEPWSRDTNMVKSKRDFYEYNSMMMEPWDGPASIIFSDGDIVGASLDRNGLRPSRYYLTKDNFLILASETGSFFVDEANVLSKRRLEPGKILLVDTVKKKLYSDEEVKNKYATSRPYHEWLTSLKKLENIDIDGFSYSHNEAKCVLFQQAFGYSYDNLIQGIIPAATKKEESLVSMGNDIPLAVLSDRPQPLYNYFKQLFAQVTNPPIDAIREGVITSTRMYLGREGNLLEPSDVNAKRVKIKGAVISNYEMYKIKNLSKFGFNVKCIEMLFDAEKRNLKERLEEIYKIADEAIDKGADILILSDKGISKEKAAIPAFLGVSALHQHLIRVSKRTHCSIVVESGEPCEIHHFACLLGYGATAINPYMVYESIYDLISKKMINDDFEHACQNYNAAVMKGIVKIISKMGIATVQAYNGSQIFECIGLNENFVDEYFTDTRTSIGGIGLEEVMSECLIRHNKAFDELNVAVCLDAAGNHYMRNKREEHLYNPFTIYKLQNACRTNNYAEFKEYSSYLNDKLMNIRNLMDFDTSESISIDEVESVESIVKRFKTGAMSYGSISKEAHECLAVAMNRIGGKSNTGEGGEDASRFMTEPNGDIKSSAIKQVASGRFGVTMEYLVNAKEIQIKMAQGAKPGEGGQLPANKVYPWIASSRHSTPGVALISPPPHHDIYSIEDLAQLIYDLKNANRKARISVKLVSEQGIGTVASGVAKAGANVILISGFDGGTGASPKTSIYNTGMPWEIGLAEAHQTLILNGLRERVCLETDGKLMTGRDLAVAALLGADEFGFATAPLIVMGCVMMRVCNLDTCPVGIATQNTELRKRFKGKPEYIINFMYFIANELREYMALLGFRTVNEMIGRIDKLKTKAVSSWKGQKVVLDKILANREILNKTHVHFEEKKETFFEKTLDVKVLLPLCNEALENGKKVKIDLEVKNVNRSFGTILSSEITKKYGSKGLEEDTIVLNCYGHPGNSLGAFLTKGVTINVIGDANDYLGKGLCGGKISVRLSQDATFNPSSNIIIGNVCLYGATSGKVFLDGLAGERFAVRNSGAKAVVLGVGEHGCEYMTGGKVLILGEIGRNFAAGMSGGVAYIYDEFGNANNNINNELVNVSVVKKNEDVKEILDMIEEHIISTNSIRAKAIMKSFEPSKFIKVIPADYEKMIETTKQFVETGLSRDEALLAAFYKNTSSKEAR